MASPVPPAFSWSPMPPSPASPSCSSTLWRGLLGGLCIGAVAAVVLFISCVKINRQRETAPSQNRQRETAPTQNGQRETAPSQNRQRETPPSQNGQRETAPSQNRQRETPPTQNRQRETPPSQNRQRETPPPNASTASATRRAGKRIFTFREVKSFTKDFSSLLGEGGSANVYKGTLSTGEEVAVKQLTRGGGQEFETEVEKLSRAHHKHVVSLVGYCIEEGQQIVVYEYVPNNTLKFHLHGHGAGRRDLNWPERLKIAFGSAKGLAYLHEYCHPKIIHRDIKATNILLDRDFEAKIADFGLAKCISESETHVSTAVRGTPGYLDPEYWQSSQLTEKTDIYSFGMVLLRLITGRKLEEGQGGLYTWVLSQLPRDLKGGNFDSIVDPRLQNVYDRREMARMVRCAVACVHHFSNVRPKMSEIVRALEGRPDLPQTPTHLFLGGPGRARTHQPRPRNVQKRRH